MTACVGTAIGAVETPALVVDLDALERNIARMAAFARVQIAAGAVGVCVQKLSEAEALAALGIDDIFITNEIVDPAKLARLAGLAVRVRLAIAVDSALGIARLANALKAVGSEVDV